MENSVESLIDKIDKNEAVVGILGLGYVGLPLGVLFAKNNFRVIGFDKNEKKVAAVNNGENYISDIEDSDLETAAGNKKISATGDFKRINECDILIICVPTPLDKFKKPDMSYIENASIEIGKNMKIGSFISLESTTYPTTTEKFMLPILERESKMKVNRDFWVCFSPERVDPGNKKYKTENTPKVIGALGEDARKIAEAVYGKVIKTLYHVSSPRIAEMVKILENTYRLVNISMVNELALLCGKMDIMIWEVIEAAATKPYGFQAFYPGPGIGGHCIPLDPFYLEYVARQYDFDLTMIHTAGQIDNLMAHRMCIKIQSALNRQKKAINGSRLIFLGVAYKSDIDDPRESPALKIMDEASRKGGIVYYHDPYIPAVETGDKRKYESVRLTDDLFSDADCFIITTDHSCFDIPDIVKRAKLVVDLRNAVKETGEKIYKL